MIHKQSNITSVIVLISFLCCLNVYAQDLKKHRWKNRILIIKTTDQNAVKYQKQLAEFKMLEKEFAERKLITYEVVGDDLLYIDPIEPLLTASKKVPESIIKILKGKNAFEVILIGLDSGIKLRKTTVLTKQELFSLIDSMPMRRNELRNKSSKN